MEHTQKIVYIGNYRIRYKGKSFTTPVDDQGNLYLPDGKILRLSEKQFSMVREKIAEKRAAENAAKSMMVPTADELIQFYIPPKAESPTKAQSDVFLNFVQETIDESGASEPSNKSTVRKETPRVEGENTHPQPNLMPLKKDVLDESICEQNPVKQKKEEKKRNFFTNQETKLSVAVAILASMLVTIAIVFVFFLYFVNSGLITINSTPKANGFVIYDEFSSMTNASTASFNIGDFIYTDDVGAVSL